MQNSKMIALGTSQLFSIRSSKIPNVKPTANNKSVKIKIVKSRAVIEVSIDLIRSSFMPFPYNGVYLGRSNAFYL